MMNGSSRKGRCKQGRKETDTFSEHGRQLCRNFTCNTPSVLQNPSSSFQTNASEVNKNDLTEKRKFPCPKAAEIVNKCGKHSSKKKKLRSKWKSYQSHHPYPDNSQDYTCSRWNGVKRNMDLDFERRERKYQSTEWNSSQKNEKKASGKEHFKESTNRFKSKFQRNRDYNNRRTSYVRNELADNVGNHSGEAGVSLSTNCHRKRTCHGNRKNRTKVKEQSTNEENEIEIPGFYYDRGQKKYFKILPSHSSVPSAVTKETIVRKKAEEKRLEDIVHLLRGYVNRKSVVALPNLVTNIFKLSQGDQSSSSFIASTARTRVSTMKPQNSVDFGGNPLMSFEKVEHMLLMDANRNFDRLIGMWSTQTSLAHRIQLVDIVEKTRTDDKEQLSVKFDFDCARILQTWNKVTHICWAPFDDADQGNRILYTTMSFTGDNNSLALVRNLDPDAESHDRFMDFNLGKKITWTCAWNKCSKVFSVGSDRESLLLDVQTRRLWEYFTYRSDPLSQVFSNMTGQNLYNGTRRGQILSHDLRSTSTRPTFSLNHDKSISSLHLLQDDTLLLASDFSGQVRMWDLRMRHTVMAYEGGVNEYSQIPIHVDENERIIYGAGQDGYTRFWCLKSGELLNTIPPPCATTRETIPSVMYSQHWGNRNGNAGLLMGLKNKIYLYSSPVPD